MANKLLSLVAGLTTLVMVDCNNNPKQDLSNPPIKQEIKKEIIIPEDSIAKYDHIFKERVPEMKLDKKRGLVYVSKDGSNIYLVMGEYNRFDVNFLPAYKSFYKQGIFPTIANSYSKRGGYSGVYEGVIRLAGNNISPNLEKQYSSRFSFNDIEYLIKDNVPAEKANQYGESFSGSEIISLFKNAVSPKYANPLKDFNADEIIFFNNELKRLKLPSEIIKNYTFLNQEGDRVFNAYEVVSFIENKISPETINKYLKLGDKYERYFSGTSIIDFKEKGIPFKKVKEEWIKEYINRD